METDKQAKVANKKSVHLYLYMNWTNFVSIATALGDLRDCVCMRACVIVNASVHFGSVRCKCTHMSKLKKGSLPKSHTQK